MRTALSVKEMCIEHYGADWPPEPDPINSLTIQTDDNVPCYDSGWDMMQSYHQSDGVFRLITGKQTYGNQKWSDDVKSFLVKHDPLLPAASSGASTSSSSALVAATPSSSTAQGHPPALMPPQGGGVARLN